jgi:quercetin dioxygenase-like cupin family protein
MRFRLSRYLILLAATSLPLVAATPPAEKKPKPMIGSTVFKWEELKVRATPNGERRDVSDNPTSTLSVFECHITTLNPGRVSHDPHRHAQEELILVKEGTLEVHINGKTQNAGPGSVFFYASNDAHAVRNVGNTRATYWVINLATPVTHTPAAHNKSPTRPSGVFDWTTLTVVPTKTGERRDVLKGSTPTMDSLTCHVTTVNVGDASHGAHRHPDDEIVIVKEGTMEVAINGQTQRASAGSVVLFASNDLHGMRNAGDTKLSYYVIRMVTSATPKVAKAASASK